MSPQMFFAVLPMLLVSATIIVLLSAIAVRRNHNVAASISVLGLNLALIASLWALFNRHLDIAVQVTPLLRIDSAARLSTVMVVASALGVLTLCRSYFAGYQRNKEEIYLLVLLGTLGAVVLAAATHVASLIIGIEMMSLPMIAGIAYSTKDRRALEGGMKYLVLSTIATACMLFGFALMYAETGHMDLTVMSRVLHAATMKQPLWLMASTLVVVGFAFKLSVVPFQQWTPDVYEAAPIPVGAYLATVSKVGAMAVLLRLFQGTTSISDTLANLLVVMAVASILVGSVLGLRQTNLKRLMAYSSIAHFGYLLAVLIVSGRIAQMAAAIYLIVYLISSIGVFGVMAMMSSPMRERDVENIHEYRGLFWKRPYLTSILTVMMLSLGGVPMTAGFIGKFAVLSAAMRAQHWVLMGAIVVGSAISIFYYLRVIITLFHRRDEEHKGVSEPMGWTQTTSGFMLLTSMALVLLLGVFPNALYMFGTFFFSLHR